MQLGRWYHSCSYRFATVSKWLDIDKLDARLWWTPWRRSSPCCWAIIFAIDATVPGCACTRMMLMCARAHTKLYGMMVLTRSVHDDESSSQVASGVHRDCAGRDYAAFLPIWSMRAASSAPMRRAEMMGRFLSDAISSSSFRWHRRCTQAGCLCLQIIDNCCLQPSTIHPEAEMTQPAECVLSCGQLRMRVEWKGMKRWRWG